MRERGREAGEAGEAGGAGEAEEAGAETDEDTRDHGRSEGSPNLKFAICNLKSEIHRPRSDARGNYHPERAVDTFVRPPRLIQGGANSGG